MEEFINNFTEFRTWLNTIDDKVIWPNGGDGLMSRGFMVGLQKIRDKFDELGLNDPF